MNQYVLIYDKAARHLVEGTPKEFGPDQLDEAYALRRSAERRALSNGRDWEVVLVAAASIEAVKKSHGSYFFTVDELLHRFEDTVQAGRDRSVAERA